MPKVWREFANVTHHFHWLDDKPSRRHLCSFKGFSSEIARTGWLASFFHQRDLEGAAMQGGAGCEPYNSRGHYSHRLQYNHTPWSWTMLKP